MNQWQIQFYYGTDEEENVGWQDEENDITGHGFLHISSMTCMEKPPHTEYFGSDLMHTIIV